MNAEVVTIRNPFVIVLKSILAKTKTGVAPKRPKRGAVTIASRNIFKYGISLCILTKVRAFNEFSYYVNKDNDVCILYYKDYIIALLNYFVTILFSSTLYHLIVISIKNMRCNFRSSTLPSLS